MPQHSSICSLYKLIFRHSFQRYTLPKSSFHSKSLTSQHLHHSLSPRKLSKPPNFIHPTSSNSSTQIIICQNVRQYSVDTSKEVDEINLKFAEAREEIESAMDSKETVYFDEEAECARAAVKEVLDLFDGLLTKLPDSEKGVVRRSMGLKIEQLKAELEQLNE